MAFHVPANTVLGWQYAYSTLRYQTLLASTPVDLSSKSYLSVWMRCVSCSAGLNVRIKIWPSAVQNTVGPVTANWVNYQTAFATSYMSNVNGVTFTIQDVNSGTLEVALISGSDGVVQTEMPVVVLVAWSCGCASGYACTAGCSEPYTGHTCSLTTSPTTSPTTAAPTTSSPTVVPTVNACAEGTHNCDQTGGGTCAFVDRGYYSNNSPIANDVEFAYMLPSDVGSSGHAGPSANTLGSDQTDEDGTSATTISDSFRYDSDLGYNVYAMAFHVPANTVLGWQYAYSTLRYQTLLASTPVDLSSKSYLSVWMRCVSCSAGLNVRIKIWPSAVQNTVGPVTANWVNYQTAFATSYMSNVNGVTFTIQDVNSGTLEVALIGASDGVVRTEMPVISLTGWSCGCASGYVCTVGCSEPYTGHTCGERKLLSAHVLDIVDSIVLMDYRNCALTSEFLTPTDGTPAYSCPADDSILSHAHLLMAVAASYPANSKKVGIAVETNPTVLPKRLTFGSADTPAVELAMETALNEVVAEFGSPSGQYSGISVALAVHDYTSWNMSTFLRPDVMSNTEQRWCRSLWVWDTEIVDGTNGKTPAELFDFATTHAVSTIMIEAFWLLDDNLIGTLRAFILAAWARGLFVELLMGHHTHAHVENHAAMISKVEKGRDLFIELETAGGGLNGPVSPYSHCKEIKWAWETPAPTRALTSAPSPGPMYYTEVQQGTIIVNGVGLPDDQEISEGLIKALAQIASIPSYQIKVTSRQIRSGLQFQYEIRYLTQQEGSDISTTISSASGTGDGVLMSTLATMLTQDGYSGTDAIKSATAHRWCCT